SVTHGIGFEVTTEEGSCADCHFIQFVKAFSYDMGGNASNGMYQGSTWRRYGEWYLDTAWIAPELPWYDTYGSHTRENGRLSIYDWPSVNLSPDASRAG